MINFQLEMERFHYSSQYQRTVTQDLQLTGHLLDNAYLSMKLRLVCLSVAQGNLFQAGYEWPLLPILLRHIQQHNLDHTPAIGVYYYTYLTLTNRDQPAYFDRLVSMIFEHQRAFPEAEIRSILLMTINYCIRKLNDGDRSFAEKGLDLYQAGLEHGLLFHRGFLTPFTYRNIIAMGLLLKKYTWVESFLHTYKDKLDITHREAIYSFNLAKLQYEKGLLDQAQTLLHQQYYDDLLLNLAAKTLLLKIYFESKATKQLEAHLQSMEIFIRRKKIIGYHKKNYLNMVYLCQYSYFDESIRPKGIAKTRKGKLKRPTPLRKRNGYSNN